jgi:hypothetical protein
MIMMAWFHLDDWTCPLLAALQEKHVRLALPDRQRLTAAATTLAETVARTVRTVPARSTTAPGGSGYAPDADRLLGLLKVLDDEPSRWSTGVASSSWNGRRSGVPGILVAPIPG